jgi:hypothetical protein
MTTLEQLPPDQRAVLSLLLRQRKRYDEVASALGLGPEAVHDRAHAALAVLAPRQARLLDHAERERIGEYLLGQQSDQEAAATKAYLAGSTPAREWARAVALELVKLAAGSMPEIPDAAHEPPASTPLADPIPSSSPPISRRGGAVLLGAIVIVAAVAIAIVLSSGKGGGASGSQSSDTKSSTSQSQSETHGTGKAKLEKEAALKPAQPGSKAEGAAFIATEGTKRALYMAAKGLPATNGFSYVVWLIPTQGKPFAFGRTPSVGAKGSFQAAELLTTDPSTLAGIEITQESSPRPSAPGTVVLRGTFKTG